MRYLEDKRRALNGRQPEQQTRPQNGAAAQKQPITMRQTAQTAVQRPQAQVQSTTQRTTQSTAQSRPQNQATPAVQPTAPPQTTGQDSVQAAQELLNQQLGSYQSQYGGQIDSLLQQLQGQGPFQYDVNTDPLYLQLRDQWMRDGKMAMEDTMGQAAQLTGGYGNSYAQTAGQQVYNGYLRELNEMVPQLKEAARADFDAENAYLMQQLGLLMDQDRQDYSRWMDELNRQRYEQEWQYQLERDALADQRYDQEWQYQQDRDALADQRYQDEWQYQQERDQLSDSRYDQEWQYQQDRDALADQRYDDELAYGRDQDSYNRQQDAYDQLLELIITTGYKPSAEELAAAGMTEAQAKAWLGYWQGQQAVGGSSGGSRTYSSGGNQSVQKVSDGNEQSAQQKIVYTREELGDPLKKEDYVTVYANCAVLAGNGRPASEMAAYIKQALNSGAITQEQYEKLLAQFGGLRDTGSTPGGGRNRNDRRNLLN